MECGKHAKGQIIVAFSGAAQDAILPGDSFAAEESSALGQIDDWNVELSRSKECKQIEESEDDEAGAANPFIIVAEDDDAEEDDDVEGPAAAVLLDTFVVFIMLLHLDLI